MHSRIYKGSVAHCRLAPVVNRFQYRIAMLYLDLDEVDELVRRRILTKRRFAPISVPVGVHMRGMDQELPAAVRDRVEQETGNRPSGPIRLLTQPRCFGYYFSPLNLYFCFDEAGEEVVNIVAEVNNTPWGEQHCYVLWDGNRTSSSQLAFSHPKGFHVSPFMDMEVVYHWRVDVTSRQLQLQIDNTRGDERFFSASMSLAPHPLTRDGLKQMAIGYPLMTSRIMAAIHWQALKLWWKKCPFYSHPKTLQPSEAQPVNSP